MTIFDPPRFTKAKHLRAANARQAAPAHLNFPTNGCKSALAVLHEIYEGGRLPMSYFMPTLSQAGEPVFIPSGSEAIDHGVVRQAIHNAPPGDLVDWYVESAAISKFLQDQIERGIELK